MRALLFAFGALGGLLIFPAAAQNAAPMVSPQELLTSPERYVNKSVRLRGQMNSCFNLGCSICDTGAAGAPSCLPLLFATDVKGTDPKDVSTARRVERLLQDQFRFAEVTIDARFDPSCLATYLKTPPGADGSVRLKDGTKAGICLDHAPLLFETRVVEVHARPSGRAYEKDAVRNVLAPPDSEAERQAMLAVFSPAYIWAPNRQRVILVGSAGSGENTFGYGCVCREDDCKDRWPNTDNAALDSPANPYRCFQMTKEGGVWRMALPL